MAIPPAHLDPLIGKILAERYRITELVGSGRFSVVYKGQHLFMDRAVAMKTLQTELIDDQTIIKRFEKEAVALSKLRHPNIVSVYDCFVHTNGQPFLVMDFLDGHTLEELLADRGAIPPKLMRAIVFQASAGLVHAHTSGVLHRDIKPDNIILLPREKTDERVRLLDFGFALLQGDLERLTLSGTLCGSPAYISPERWKGRELDGRSDIYSLAIVMFQGLTGELPFAASSLDELRHKHLTEEPRLLAEVRPALADDEVAQSIVSKALAKNPEDRYQSMKEFHNAVKAWMPKSDDAEIAQWAKNAKPSSSLKKNGSAASAPATAGTTGLPVAPPAIDLTPADMVAAQDTAQYAPPVVPGVPVPSDAPAIVKPLAPPLNANPQADSGLSAPAVPTTALVPPTLPGPPAPAPLVGSPASVPQLPPAAPMQQLSSIVPGGISSIPPLPAPPPSPGSVIPPPAQKPTVPFDEVDTLPHSQKAVAEMMGGSLTDAGENSETELQSFVEHQDAKEKPEGIINVDPADHAAGDVGAKTIEKTIIEGPALKETPPAPQQTFAPPTSASPSISSSSIPPLNANAANSPLSPENLAKINKPNPRASLTNQDVAYIKAIAQTLGDSLGERSKSIEVPVPGEESEQISHETQKLSFNSMPPPVVAPAIPEPGPKIVPVIDRRTKKAGEASEDKAQGTQGNQGTQAPWPTPVFGANPLSPQAPDPLQTFAASAAAAAAASAAAEAASSQIAASQPVSPTDSAAASGEWNPMPGAAREAAPWVKNPDDFKPSNFAQMDQSTGTSSSSTGFIPYNPVEEGSPRAADFTTQIQSAEKSLLANGQTFDEASEVPPFPSSPFESMGEPAKFPDVEAQPVSDTTERSQPPAKKRRSRLPTFVDRDAEFDDNQSADLNSDSDQNYDPNQSQHQDSFSKSRGKRKAPQALMIPIAIAVFIFAGIGTATWILTSGAKPDNSSATQPSVNSHSASTPARTSSPPVSLNGRPFSQSKNSAANSPKANFDNTNGLMASPSDTSSQVTASNETPEPAKPKVHKKRPRKKRAASASSHSNSNSGFVEVEVTPGRRAYRSY